MSPAPPLFCPRLYDGIGRKGVDIWRAAQLLIANDRDGAEAKARRLLEHCQRQGAVQSVAFWRRVEVAIGELWPTKPAGRVH